jgi:hypothetical protein
MNRCSLGVRLLSCVFLLLAARGATAALVAYEGFDYAAGANVTSQTGGPGAWDSAWRGAASPNLTTTVGSVGLSYPGLLVSGLAGDTTTTGATAINFRDVGPFNSGDVWLSFLAKGEAANAVNSGSNFFGLSTYDGSDAASGAVMSIAKNSTSTKWGLVAFPTSTAGSGPQGTGTLNVNFTNPATPDIVVGDTYLLVTQFHFATGAGADLADTVTLYINPGVAAMPPITPDVVYTDTLTPVTGQLNFDRIRIGAQAGRDWLYDEIRIGDSFADVVPPAAVPEAGGFAMCGAIAAMGLLVRRRWAA